MHYSEADQAYWDIITMVFPIAGSEAEERELCGVDEPLDCQQEDF